MLTRQLYIKSWQYGKTIGFKGVRSPLAADEHAAHARASLTHARACNYNAASSAASLPTHTYQRARERTCTSRKYCEVVVEINTLRLAYLPKRQTRRGVAGGSSDGGRDPRALAIKRRSTRLLLYCITQYNNYIPRICNNIFNIRCLFKITQLSLNTSFVCHHIR